ncbi:MAG TPA: ROK family protein [Gaiellaceae bacterium]|nr:ROK family protein [Gaiellaceae bacterium]
MAEPSVIGVDVGGTKIAVGVVDRTGEVRERRSRRTPTGSQAALLEALDDAIRELVDSDVAAIGLAVPSRIDRLTGRALGSVNIRLEDVDLDDRFRERFGLPVGVENDANAATFAEWRFGAGAGTRSMVMLTLGTGVGGGFVLDGALYRGWAEVGHMVIDHDGPPCQGTCTGRGHLEAFASGHAATEAARAVFGPTADSRALVRLAEEGDERALAILNEIGRKLGSGIGTLVNLFDPEVVVVGGGFSAAGELILEPAREVMRREALAPANERLRVVRATLGNAAGLVGAGLIGFEALAAAA